MSTVLDKVTPIIEPIVTDFGCQLVDIEYVKEGKAWFLRVYADKDGRIDIEDCVEISEAVSNALDQMQPDPFPEAYFLEVSSPGAERPLKTQADMEAAIGQYIHLDYYAPQYGEKFHEGTLLAVDQDRYCLEIRIKTATKQIEINKKDVAKARMAIKF
ncbi:ribosome maturation factor RimP [Vaginisenegalia massiliensis]|uniref:ribosome maturation factor RimP n=1 Tax=Vaginisenegalia massiliensis TaxID=2058294 RepID=UPI000F54C26D|nr:ribosome maturation factor RimP [Vaginisenegalia massiliensis]